MTNRRPPSSLMRPPRIPDLPARSSPLRHSCRSASRAVTPASTRFPCSRWWPSRCWPPGWSPASAHPSPGLRCCGRRTSTWRDTERTDAPVQTLSAGGDAGQVDNHSGHAWPVRGCALGDPFVPEQFFPSSDRSELLVDLKLQDNASVLATREAAAEFDKMLAADPDVVRFSTYVRQGAIRFYLPLDVALPNDFFAQSVVAPKGLKERDQVRARLEKAVAVQTAGGSRTHLSARAWASVGWPVKYRVSGPDLARVHDIALKVAEQLEAMTGIRHINFDWAEPARVMRVRIDQDQARQLGLSSQDVSLALNGVVSGSTITQVRNSIYLINVDMRAEHTERTSLESIRSLQIPLRDGNVVPLRQIASFEYAQEYPIVWRRNRVPTLTVQADVVPGLLPATAVKTVQPSIDRLAASLPSGYRIVAGGSVEESAKAQASVQAVLPAMMVLVLTILMFQLQSFQRVLLVLSVAPLGLIGVVAARCLCRRRWVSLRY